MEQRAGDVSADRRHSDDSTDSRFFLATDSKLFDYASIWRDHQQRAVHDDFTLLGESGIVQDPGQRSKSGGTSSTDCKNFIKPS